MSTLEPYVGEDGDGPYSPLYVHDLVPVGTQGLVLVFVFESPHFEEVDADVPVVGRAGQLALDYLLHGQANGQSLGRAVEAQHSAGNERIAILNVCNVPLQKAGAAEPDAPGFTADEWALLEAVRKSDARTVRSMMSPAANVLDAILLRSLEQRMGDLVLAPTTVIVAAGKCAKRFLRSIPPPSGATQLSVPHPSRGQWQRDPQHAGLLEMRRLYALHS